MKIYSVALLVCCLAGAVYPSCISPPSCGGGGGGIDVVTKQQQILPIRSIRTSITTSTTITSTSTAIDGLLAVLPEGDSPYTMFRTYSWRTSIQACGSRVLYALDSVTSVESSYILHFDIRTKLHLILNLLTSEYIYYYPSSCGGDRFFRVFFNPYNIPTIYFVDVYTGQMYFVYVDCIGSVTLTEVSYIPDAAFQLFGQVSLNLIITNGAQYAVQARDLIYGEVIDFSVYTDSSSNVLLAIDLLGFEYAVVNQGGSVYVVRAYKSISSQNLYIRQIITDGGSGSGSGDFCSLTRLTDVSIYGTSCSPIGVFPYIRTRSVYVAPTFVTLELQQYLVITYPDGTQRKFLVTSDGNGLYFTTSLAGYRLIVIYGTDGWTIYRTVYIDDQLYVISPVTRRLMQVIVVDGSVQFITVTDTSLISYTNFLTYNVIYSVETVGSELYLVIYNVDLDITFRVLIRIIDSLYVVCDDLTGVEFVVMQGLDNSYQLMQCWMDDSTVIVDYQGQYSSISYTQGSYTFTSVQWGTVLAVIETDLSVDSRYYVPCYTSSIVC